MLRSYRIERDRLEEQELDVGELPEQLGASKGALWLDLVSPDENELGAVADALELHPLARERLAGRHRRAGMARYPQQLGITAFLLGHGRGRQHDALYQHELQIVLSDAVVVTVRHDDHLDTVAVLEHWQRQHTVGDRAAGQSRRARAEQGALALIWALLDLLVDTHLDQLQHLDERIEQLEEQLFTEKPDTLAIQHAAYALHKQAFVLRRAAVPMHDVLVQLLDTVGDTAAEELLPFLKDVRDHAHRVDDWTGAAREMIDTLIDATQAIRGNQMNLVMKKVTSWAAIIAVPTLISGVYGMNVPLPLEESPVALWLLLGLMLATAGLLYWQFRRKDWL